jgi:torulene dioxygenase
MQADGKTSYYAYGLQNAVEQREPIRLKVKGSIPPWLTGSLYRTGPGTHSIPLKSGGVFHVKHWFDGMGMNHRFEIKEGGEVWYRSRKSTDHLEQTVSESGQMPIITFASADPCETLFHKFFTVFKQSVLGFKPAVDQPSSMNLSVTLTPNMPGVNAPTSHSTTKSSSTPYLVAKSDVDLVQVVDAETLEPQSIAAYHKMDPRLAKGALSGAHACTHVESGDFYNYVSTFGNDMSYKVFRIRGSGPDRGKMDVLAEIRDAPIAYLHSSCLTEKYFILCVWQADFKK